MSGSGRASKSGLGYEVEKKMEQVRSMTHDQLNVLFRIIFFNHWNAFFFISADDYEAYSTATYYHLFSLKWGCGINRLEIGVTQRCDQKSQSCFYWPITRESGVPFYPSSN